MHFSNSGLVLARWSLHRVLIMKVEKTVYISGQKNSFKLYYYHDFAIRYTTDLKCYILCSTLTLLLWVESTWSLDNCYTFLVLKLCNLSVCFHKWLTLICPYCASIHYQTINVYSCNCQEENFIYVCKASFMFLKILRVI